MMTAMIEGTPKTKAPIMVAAVVIPIIRLRACKAYTRCVTVTRPGAGAVAGISMLSVMSAGFSTSGRSDLPLEMARARSLLADHFRRGLGVPSGHAVKLRYR